MAQPLQLNLPGLRPKGQLKQRRCNTLPTPIELARDRIQVQHRLKNSQLRIIIADFKRVRMQGFEPKVRLAHICSRWATNLVQVSLDFLTPFKV